MSRPPDKNVCLKMSYTACYRFRRNLIYRFIPLVLPSVFEKSLPIVIELSIIRGIRDTD